MLAFNVFGTKEIIVYVIVIVIVIALIALVRHAGSFEPGPSTASPS